MPLPYSADLRERVLVAWEQGEGTAAELAHRFGSARRPSTTGAERCAPKGGGTPSRWGMAPHRGWMLWRARRYSAWSWPTTMPP